MYRPRKHGDHDKSFPGQHRRKRISKHNNLKGWQPGDGPCPRAHCGSGSGRGPTTNNNRRAISRSSRQATQQGLHSGKNLAIEKKSRCVPNCDYHRCAANDLCYAKPFYAPREPQLEKHTSKIEIEPKKEQKRSTAQENKGRDVEDDTPMEEEEVEEPPNELPEDYGYQTSSECSESSCDSFQVENTAKRQSGAWDMGLRPLTMKTVACNTDRSCYTSCYYHAAQARAREAQIRAQTKAKRFQTLKPVQSRAPQVVQTRVLKDIDSNATLVLLEKQPPRISREKMVVARPLPRVALLRPPRPPATFQMLTKQDREMIQHANQKRQFQTPRPAVGQKIVLHENDYKIAPPEVYLHSQFSQTSTPRRDSPRQDERHRYAQNLSETYEKWSPGKPSPRLATPSHALRIPRDATTSYQQHSIPQTDATTPQRSAQQRDATTSRQSMQQYCNHSCNPKTLSQMSTSTCESTPISTPPKLTPPNEISSQSYNDDSEISKTSNSTTNSKSSASVCACCFCRQSQSASRIYGSNNPFHDIVRPVQSSARTRGGNAVAPGRWWSWLLAFCELLALLVAAGVFAVKVVPSVESLFRAYMAGSCGGNGVGSGPHLTADGLKSGVVNWMTCPAGAAAS